MRTGLFRIKIPLVLILGIIFLSIPESSISAQGVSNQENVSLELNRVKKKIAEEQSQLKRLKTEETSLFEKIETVDQELEQAQAERKDLVSTLADLEKKQKVATRAVVKIEKAILDKRESLSGRIVAIYKLYRRSSALDYLWKSASPIELMKRARYLTRIAEHDYKLLETLSSLTDELAGEQKRLESLSTQRKKRITEIGVLEAKLEEKKFQQADLLTKLQGQKKRSEIALGKLKKSASRLEKILARVMGGGEPDDTAPVGPAPFSGRGLAHLKGKLPLPIKGKLMQRFGRQRHKDFEDVLFVKGLEFKGLLGARVKAVAPGKVVFGQVLPGYGNVVVLDHGKRFYTLYGRVASTLVQVGDRVEQGDVLAVLGQADHRSRNFYFELRIKGKARDPSSYFKETL